MLTSPDGREHGGGRVLAEDGEGGRLVCGDARVQPSGRLPGMIMDGWIYGFMDGCMDGCMDGWQMVM